MIEVLPVAHFGGRRGWGYDGVLLYAPHAAYGTPEDFKAFIDAAHGYGISVVLDIVLNHFGPQGNYLPLISPDFFHPERKTPWGAGIANDVEAVRHYIAEAPSTGCRNITSTACASMPSTRLKTPPNPIS